MLLGIFCTNLSFFNTASGMDCMQLSRERRMSGSTMGFNTASGMDCMQFGKSSLMRTENGCFNTASGMDCMQFQWNLLDESRERFQYRKRYGLHAMEGFEADLEKAAVSIPQAVWIACNDSCFLWSLERRASFNTASGMDCMQYRPSQPLGQLNPEAGFLNGSLFLANRRNPAGFFCRQNRLKTSANPVISRKLLSTGKI